MIQRIQSVYLFLAFVLLTITIFSPLAIFKDTQEYLLVLEPMGIFKDNANIFPTWGIISITGLASILCLVNILLFKNRKRQITICSVTILLILLLYATIACYSYFGQNSEAIMFEGIQYGIVLPVIALIFNVLALIKIKADEKLVRSLDRIR